MGLSRTVSGKNEDFQSKIAKLALRMRATMWPVRSGCKIIQYLESQTLDSY